MEWFHRIEIQLTLLLEVASVLITIPWILMTKKDSTSALAWCLLVLVVPIFGAVFFVLFGYQHVSRPLKRKRRHKMRFGQTHDSEIKPGALGPASSPEMDRTWENMARLAERFGAFPIVGGNAVDVYDDGRSAFDAMFAAIEAARHHIHLEFFIIQADNVGQCLLELLAAKARQGVEVRLLYDAMGSHRLRTRCLCGLHRAGGKTSVFLPINIVRRRVQINMRNHRKLLIVDGNVGFTGGLNIGDEYLGRVRRFGHWRDTHLRIQGPAVSGLQRVFIEDWDFAASEELVGKGYYPKHSASGPHQLQIIHSGPDQELNSVREVYFAAILRARERLWIATPYFVPDVGLRSALTQAGFSGIDVRLLCQYHPDKWIPLFAGRYYWDEMLKAGVKVYQYAKGMMHAKTIMVDGEWASVGSANLDNRSLSLNFEANCLVYSNDVVARLEAAFLNDLADSIRLRPQAFAERPLAGRIVENACRLLSPIL